MAPGVAAIVGAGAHGKVDLRGDDHLAAAAPRAQPPADDALALAAAAVHVGRVDQVDAGGAGAIEDALRFGFHDRVREVVGAQRKR